MASRRKNTRQSSSGSGAAQGQSGGDGGPNQQLLQQYTEGKKSKVKYLGSQDIEDYRNKRETSAIMADLKRRSSKAPKPKAIITLFTKELIVMDEKSKTVTMKVPVSKVKFVCHNKNDPSLFGIILATDRITSDSQRLHRMFCYQADSKIAATFVRSVNELFQILAEIMRERRSRAEANRTGDQATGGSGANATRGVATSSGGGTSGGGGGGGGQANQSQSQGGGSGQQQQATGGDPMSDDERYEPVPLGFGIEAPPPSYKAAISKKNESIFKKPDDVQTTVTTRLPPPPSSRVKKPAPVPPASRQSAPPGRLSAPPPSQGRRTAAPAPPPPASTTVSQTAPTARNATPTSATSLPLPQVPLATVSNSASVGATFNIGSADEEDIGFGQNTEGNIYDVPTNNQPAPPGQGQREAVWQEWQALESELQTIAQDLGFDMDSNNGAVGGATSTILPPIEDINIPPPNVTSEASFTEDPFADDFFQTSFSSPSASLSSQSAWPGASTDTAGDQATEDPFSAGGSFETAWGTLQPSIAISQATGVSSENADPFQEDLATPTGSSGGNQTAAARDPFQDTTTPTSPPVSFDFAGFSAESPWNESASVTTTTTSTITQAVPTASFDADFGSDWGAFGGDTSTNTASPSTTASQAPKKQDSQPEPAAILSPPPKVTTPRRAEATRMPATTTASTTTASEDSFGPSSTAVPPPALQKRDSAILKPPPVSPTRRADAMSDRSQSTSSRSRPRPSGADQAQAPVAMTGSQVVLNRPPKSKSSPSQTRAYSGEIEPQQQINIPSPDFGIEAEVASTSFDAMFDTSTSDNQDSGGVSLTSSVTSDPFQSSLPPVSSSSSEPSTSDPFQSVTSTTTQAAISNSIQGAPIPTSQTDNNVGELFFQESLSPPSSTVTASQATFDDPFQGGTPQAFTAVSELSLGNPFQEVSPQHISLSTAQQVPASDPFQGGFPPAAVSSSGSKTISDDLFGSMAQPSTGDHDPFQSSMQPPTSTDSQVGAATQAETAKSPPEFGSDGGGDNWSGFGDMWTSKKQETTPSDDWSAAFGGTGSAETATKSKQEPVPKRDGWSDSAFGSQPQQQKEEQKQQANSSFSGFGDNWGGFPDVGKAAASTPQSQPPSVSKTAEVSGNSTVTSALQNNTEPSWNVFGQDSFSTPSTSLPSAAQSQPQVQQKSAKPGLLPPPSSKSSRPSGSSGSPLSSSHSRPRSRPSGERAPGSGGLLNPPSSQKAQSGSSARGGQAQAGTTVESTTSNPLNKSEVSTKKSGGYLDDLSSVSAPTQPQFSPMSMNTNMNYPGMGSGGVGGPLFQQQQQQQQQPQAAGGWGSPPGTTQSPPFSQQPMQTPPQQQPQQQTFQSYGGPQSGAGGGSRQGMTPQQQQQYMQQQQAMYMQQQQQAMQQGPPGAIQRGPPGSMAPGQMQQGPPGAIQRGPPGSIPPGQMQQGPPGAIQRGPPGSMQQGSPRQMQQGPMMQQGPPGAMQPGPPGSMQGGYANMQQMPPGQMAMQQGVMGGMQFSPGGPQQMIGPPGQGGQMPPGPQQFSTPEQQQQYYYQQRQQQNPNAFSPTGQPNPLTPGNASMGGGQFTGSNLSTSHLNASGFSSPPYAVGSSTPQSGTPGTAPQAPADLPPATVEYRPSVNDGRPDPFAALVTGALTPSKDKRVDAEKLKAAFIKQPSPNRFPSPGPTYYSNAPNNSANPQGGWV